METESNSEGADTHESALEDNHSSATWREPEVEIELERLAQEKLVRSAELVNRACTVWLRRRGLQDEFKFGRVNASPTQPRQPQALNDRGSLDPDEPHNDHDHDNDHTRTLR